MFCAGERDADLHGVSGPSASWGSPPGDGCSSLTCADRIKLFDDLPVIADPVSVGEPRPSALAREALLTDYASAQVSHVCWTGSTAARRPALCQCWRVAQVAQLAQRHAPRLLAAEGISRLSGSVSC